ncbi:hypothetical protein PT974_10341 [Cladobotryum mycophilum]|uniref:Phytanoyl-CoA dioxygenase family protein n=1 Tax=Cladobotryum mycophilum TaxID=491253 RepID=A0ABR0SAL5_9HYPO
MQKRPGPPGDPRIHYEVGANKRLAIPQSTIEPRVQQLIDHVVEHGYVVIPNAFSPLEIEEARAEVARLTSQGGPAAAHGRNTFEGVKTQRIYALLNKSRAFDKFTLHPDVLALNDYFLEPGYLLTLLQSINILPGEAEQTIHHDDAYVTVPRPHNPFSTGVMIAIDDYTATNGSTVIIPKSHTWDSEREPKRSETQSVIMPSGSIMYFLGTLYHGGGANTSDKNRLALTSQYCQPWLRTYENMILAVEWDKLDKMPPRLVDMLGYKVASPHVGAVDGTSPRAAVVRLMEKWKRENKGDSRL